MEENSTIRQWLTKLGFDWSGPHVIVWQELEEGNSPSSWNDPIKAHEILDSHPILDTQFDSGFGSASCPCFVAYDRSFVYFPSKYDGATFPNKVALHHEFYLDIKNHTPYPGGG